MNKSIKVIAENFSHLEVQSDAGNMRRYDNIGAIPQRTFHGQRLRIENVENGLGNVPPVEGALERVRVDDVSAANVDEDGLPEAAIGQRFPGE